MSLPPRSPDQQLSVGVSAATCSNGTVTDRPPLVRASVPACAPVSSPQAV